VNTKSQLVREAWSAGDRIGALRIAARFHDRSFRTKIYQRGMDAHNHPAFYRQIGQDPELLVAIAMEALEDRFISSPLDGKRRYTG
jgi:hypothetical protein